MQRHAMIYFICTLLSFAHLTLVDAEYKDCGSVLGALGNVKVSGCDSESVCHLVKGSNVSLDITFVAKKPIATVHSRVYGILLDVPMPFSLDHPNACADPASEIHCLLTEGSEHTYHAVLPVHKYYPKVFMIVQWELLGNNNEEIIFILIESKIV